HTEIYFDAVLRFYGRKRTGLEKKLIVKTDSWHLMFYHQLRRMYPHTPFVVIIRSPDEVIRSQHKVRGMHSVPGLIEPHLLGLKEDDFSHDFDHYMATVLERYFSAILAMQHDPLCRVLDYNKGMELIMQYVLQDAHIQPSSEDDEKMKERLRYHSKSPNELFAGEPSMPAAPAYMSHCFELYRQLGGTMREPHLLQPE
ncbi:MAG TPA: hypothetical protein VNR87_04500, partial [Flavisolibacter sp.]|nr:hypothetical protein [Flavisolibacter sp.]